MDRKQHFEIEYTVGRTPTRGSGCQLKIVQENMRRIEDDIAVEDDDDDEVPDGQFSDTEDENSTNAPIVPGCRADKARATSATA